MKQVIALVGDYWHTEDMIEDAVNAAVKQLEGVQLTMVTHEGLVDGLKSKPAAVLLFKMNGLNVPQEPVINWMTPDIETAIIQYVDEGGSWLAWHTGLAGYDKDSNYVGMLRGRFLHHPEMKAITYTGKEGNFTLHDEHYFVDCDTEHTDVFLTSSSVDGESLAGWAHPHGKGKVCCLTPAHTREGLQDPSFQKLLTERIQLLI